MMATWEDHEEPRETRQADKPMRSPGPGWAGLGWAGLGLPAILLSSLLSQWCRAVQPAHIGIRGDQLDPKFAELFCLIWKF